MADIYEQLAHFLDELPGGFPASKSGVEVRILRRLFMPEEAAITMHLSLLSEEAHVIAHRAGLPVEQARDLLEGLDRKRLIYCFPEEGKPRTYMAQQFLVGFTWLCLVLAAAKPEWVGPPVEQRKSGRDLMIAVDLSGSMQATDFTLPDGSSANRLEAVKYVLARLAAQRASDRLGLIVFGNAPYLQSPFTDDHQVWAQLLGETDIGMAGQSTAFGDAIGLAIKLFRSKGDLAIAVDRARPHGSFFLQGFIVIISNPKMLVLFGAMIPPFITAARQDFDCCGRTDADGAELSGQRHQDRQGHACGGSRQAGGAADGH